MRSALPLCLATLLACAGAGAAEIDNARREPATHAPATRLIVKLRDAAPEQTRARAQSADAARATVAALAARTGVALRAARAITRDIHVVEVEPGAPALEAALAKVRADASVVYAEPDERRYPHAVPDDPGFANQWYLQAVEASAIDAVSAWDVTVGSDGVVIADIDTGVRFEHPDLLIASAEGRLLPGYDFIEADLFIANDGDGRDDDPADPGDWMTADDLNEPGFGDCAISDSSWHGTRVAGILGALTNNSTGVAGVTWNAYILPVRVLGKCGGFDSDIIAGMLWAGGESVSGVPDNPFPAKIENLSLGSTASCNAAYQDTIETLAARGVLVVAAAGNEGGPVGTPASCPGAAGIAGLRHAGSKVGFSSLGPEIAVSAPGGNCVTTGPGDPCLFSLDTTTNTGTTTPATNTYTDQFNANFGTSFSAPIVSGIAGLMAAVNGNLNAAQLIARLQEGATPFPDTPVEACHVPTGPGDLQTAECDCTTDTCGAGMANASAAVEAALRPIAAVDVVGGNVTPGAEITLDATRSAAACGQTVATWTWEVVDGTGDVAPGPEPGTAIAVAPMSGEFTVRLTVTDDVNRTDTADIVLTPTSATTTAPADAGSTPCLEALEIPDPELVVDASARVGHDLQAELVFSLGITPAAPVDVTIEASDGDVALSDDPGEPGAQSVVFADLADPADRTLYVQGLAQGGTTTLTLSAPGFAPATVDVSVDPSGFVLPTGGLNLQTTAANADVTIQAARLDAATLAFAVVQGLRPGLTVDVPVTSSNEAVGVLTADVVTFDASADSGSTAFDPLTAGTTEIALGTPAGFDTPSERQEITATVTAPPDPDDDDGGGGGGGGALDWLAGAALAAAAARRLRAAPHRAR
jgi:serine protease